MERIGINILDPLPLTKKDNKYILVIIDYFTKYVEAYAIPNQNTQTICNVIVNKFISRFGVPKSIYSNKGANFESEIFSEVI